MKPLSVELSRIIPNRAVRSLVCYVPIVLMFLISGCRKASAPPVGPPARRLATAPPQPKWTPTTQPFWLSFGTRKTRWVALTFDAGHDDSAVRAILATLKRRRIRSTFFLTGQFCRCFPKSCRAIADAGMEIGNHSDTHPHFPKIANDAIKREMIASEESITAVCGRGAKPLFRFPFGESDRRTRKAVVDLGYQPIHWTIDSQDSFGRPKSADYVFRRIMNHIRPGYITLMHVSCKESAKALPAIFNALKKQHLYPVTIGEMLDQSQLAVALSSQWTTLSQTSLPVRRQAGNQ